MESEDYYRLLKRSDNHAITRAEFDAVAAELANPASKADPGVLMAVLRRDRTRSYESLMAPFLKGPDHNTARDALIYICLEYGQTGRYTSYILDFMQGVPYDWNDRLRATALSIASVYLNRAQNSELLREMINLAENGIDKRIREKALRGLFEAMGHNGLPYGERDLNAEMGRDYEALGPTLVKEAKQRLEKERENDSKRVGG